MMATAGTLSANIVEEVKPISTAPDVTAPITWLSRNSFSAISMTSEPSDCRPTSSFRRARLQP